jgi:hypothetical protein
MQDLGQLKLGPLTFTGPTKARISGKFIPDFTIDLSAPPKAGILSLIKPKITFLIGNAAYELSWGEKSLRSADPAIFQKETFLDSINKIGILPIAALTIAVGVVGYLVLKPKIKGVV